MKTCKRCGQTAPLTEFYAHPSSKDGLDSRCKECVKKATRENRARNLEYYREYDRTRFQNDPRVRARHRRYQATAKGKESMRASNSKWIANNQDKRAAHVILNNAVKSGRIEKPDNCSRCNQGGRIHGHHTDYSLPLDVIWLCPKCHAEEHR